MATQSTDQDEILYVSVQRGNTLGSDMPNLAHIGEGVGTEPQTCKICFKTATCGGFAPSRTTVYTPIKLKYNMEACTKR